MRPAMLGPSWTTSTTAFARTGRRRVLRALGAVGLGRGDPDMAAGALMSIPPRAGHRVPHATQLTPGGENLGSPFPGVPARVCIRQNGHREGPQATAWAPASPPVRIPRISALPADRRISVRHWVFDSHHRITGTVGRPR